VRVESVRKVGSLLKQRPVLLSHGMDVILATKLSWWETGHHTNQGKMKPYLRQALTKGFGRFAEMVDWANTVGQWASTHACLHKLGLQTGREFVPLLAAEENEVRIVVSETLKRSASTSLPAGTASHAFCETMFKTICYEPSSSEILSLCPKLEIINKCLAEVTALKRESTLHREEQLMTTNPAVFYHTRADFLTGIQGSKKSFQSQSAVGLLGSVVWHLHRGLDI
jgi:hypothetical protein